MARLLLKGLISLFVLLNSSTSQAAAPRFQWVEGQVLAYKVTQTTTATDKATDSTVEGASKLALTKQWKVLGVETGGVATLELKITAMRFEMKDAKGKWLVYDSTNVAQTDKEMKDFEKYINTPVALVRIDTLGKVVQVKEVKLGQASSFDKELPFVIVLAEAEKKTGETWERSYQISLDPPQGTGEKYDARQLFTASSADSDKLVIQFTTAVPKLPATPMDQIPLLQAQTDGMVTFDIKSGRMEKAIVNVDKEVKDHRGKDSSYHFQTSYTIKLVEN